ncbi:cyclic nucleotide-binding domain-containing protein [Crenothrix sp.]|uniref:cyclic nucleotide-binding domain-containing protein n=1 Tax=Crenothrix sp. TaxID=3100433 RepID=UPI00374D529D
MAVDLSSTEGLIIRKLIPLASLPSAPMKALCAAMEVEEIRDDFLFKKGDTDDRLIYLISGTVTLQAQDLVIDTIKADSPSARFALAHQVPRKIDAFAKGVVRYLRLNAEQINNPPPLVYQEDEGYIVIEEDGDDTHDWITTLLKAPVFHSFTPANFQKILINLEDISFNKGAVILEQGDIDDYYYLIKSGACLLTHKPSPDVKEIKLAQIGKGNSLGEDALIFDAPRTETITALTPVVLMRLHKTKFVDLIKNPLLKCVDFFEIQQILQTGATLLDVRTASEYRERHLNGSINIPFALLKGRYKMLPSENPVIITGNDDKTSEAAAFFLIKQRYSAFVLQGGLDNIPVTPENEAVFFNRVSQFSSLQNDSHWKDDIVYAGVDWLTLPNTDLDARIAFLESENKRLTKTQAELQQHYAQMKADKDEAEKQCRILFKQVDKLTQVLNKFKMAQTNRPQP